MNEQCAMSSALFVQTPAASASAYTAPSTSGTPVAVTIRRKADASPAPYSRRSTARSNGTSSSISSLSKGAITVTAAPQSRSERALWAATRPPPTTRQEWPETLSETG